MTTNDHASSPNRIKGGGEGGGAGSDQDRPAWSRGGPPRWVPVVVALVVGLGIGLGAALLLGDDPAPVERPVATGDRDRDGDPEAAADLPAVESVDVTAVDRDDPRATLEAFLSAEATGEWEASYELISQAARDLSYPNAALWVNAHADFPTVTGYRIDDVEEVDADTVRVETLTGFEPVLDPVIGLVPARGRTTWTLARGEDGSFAVEVAATENRPLYPSSEGADQAARQWVDARVSCADTTALEADLVGSPSLAQALCDDEQPEEVAVGPVRSLTDADGVSGLLSEYGPEVFSWARVAPVDAAQPLLLVLAPVGEDWQVVAALPRT